MYFWDSIKNWFISTYVELGLPYLLLMIALIVVNAYIYSIYAMITKEELTNKKRITFVASCFLVLIFIAFFGARLGRSLLIMFAAFGLFEYYEPVIVNFTKQQIKKLVAFVKRKVSDKS